MADEIKLSWDEIFLEADMVGQKELRNIRIYSNKEHPTQITDGTYVQIGDKNIEVTINEK